jgi:soluble lytic murein transglycosylase-like protein
VLLSSATVPERAALRYRPGQGAPETPFGGAIFRTARRHDVNPALVAAVVWVESGFDPEARSAKGARGLMQVMPATGRRFGVAPERLWEPEANLAAGVLYLDWLGRRFDDRTADVLAAYNAGEGAVDEHGGLPPVAETRDYVARVLGALGAGGGEVR